LKALGRFVEDVEVVKQAWSSGIDDQFSYDGKFHQYDEVYQSPDPYQEPRPPIWLGGQVDPALKRAGRLGDGYCAGPDPTEKISTPTSSTSTGKANANTGAPFTMSRSAH